MTDLPRGWCSLGLRELLADGVFADGDWVESKDQDPKGDVRLIQLADVGVGRFVDKSARFLTASKAAELRCTYLETGDVLISRMADPIGRACLFPELDHRCVTVVDVCIARPAASRADAKWLAGAINSPQFRKMIERAASGTTRSRVSRGNLGHLALGVPPLNEQRRIVAKLEALQARSRRAREALDAVPSLLEKLRQSILAAAFRGDLTKDWRAKQKGIEPATELLKRIRTERRQKWEATELGKLKSKGKPPTDDQWKAKYKEPEQVEIAGLPELPDGWCWGTAEELSEGSRPIIYGIIKAGPDFPGGTPYVRVTEVVSGDMNLANLPRCDPERAAKFGRSVLAPGDILVSKDGTIGKVAFVPPELAGANINQHVLRIATGRFVDRFYFARIVESPQCQRWMTGETKGIALQGVNVEDFRRMPMPLAPLAEQVAIVDTVAKALQSHERLIRFAASIISRLAVLERAMLAKAFRGELVPQDPNDEPAETMLAHARSTNGSAAANGTPSKRGRPRVAQGAQSSND